jgi:hypothetical protein
VVLGGGKAKGRGSILAGMAKKSKKLPKSKLKSLELALGSSDPIAMAKIDTALGNAVAPEEWKSGFPSMSEARARYLACFYLVMEVNNGGFNQFLLNKGPGVVAPALAFLQERGLKKVASMLQRAVKALPGGKLPATNDELTDVLAGDKAEKIDAAHGKIDDEFFKLDPSNELTRAGLEYVRENADEFFE